jgi:hypothetical protein
MSEVEQDGIGLMNKLAALHSNRLRGLVHNSSPVRSKKELQAPRTCNSRRREDRLSFAYCALHQFSFIFHLARCFVNKSVSSLCHESKRLDAEIQDRFPNTKERGQ